MKKPLNKFIRLSGVGVQFGVTIWLFSLLGKWLDEKFNTDKTLTIIMVLIGFVLSMYSLIKRLKAMENE
ncbi:AtpZ/AtpI family protein [Flavobacteriaceae bacterium]|nr:AtpZ/AtpI family protein [Flavobacteriaceae bacterium]